MKLSILSVLVSTSLFNHQAFANNELEHITTTASRSEVLADPLPVVVSSISQKQLALIAPTHIEQALKQVAGANLQHGNGQEYLPALRSPVLSGAGACGGYLLLKMVFHFAQLVFATSMNYSKPTQKWLNVSKY